MSPAVVIAPFRFSFEFPFLFAIPYAVFVTNAAAHRRQQSPRHAYRMCELPYRTQSVIFGRMGSYIPPPLQFSCRFFEIPVSAFPCSTRCLLHVWTQFNIRQVPRADSINRDVFWGTNTQENVCYEPVFPFLYCTKPQVLIARKTHDDLSRQSPDS